MNRTVPSFCCWADAVSRVRCWAYAKPDAEATAEAAAPSPSDSGENATRTRGLTRDVLGEVPPIPATAARILLRNRMLHGEELIHRHKLDCQLLVGLLYDADPQKE